MPQRERFRALLLANEYKASDSPKDDGGGFRYLLDGPAGDVESVRAWLQRLDADKRLVQRKVPDKSASEMTGEVMRFGDQVAELCDEHGDEGPMVRFVHTSLCLCTQQMHNWSAATASAREVN